MINSSKAMLYELDKPHLDVDTVRKLIFTCDAEKSATLPDEQVPL